MTGANRHAATSSSARSHGLAHFAPTKFEKRGGCAWHELCWRRRHALFENDFGDWISGGVWNDRRDTGHRRGGQRSRRRQRCQQRKRVLHPRPIPWMLHALRRLVERRGVPKRVRWNAAAERSGLESHQRHSRLFDMDQSETDRCSGNVRCAHARRRNGLLVGLT